MDELVVRYITSNYPKEAQARLQVGSTPLVTRPLYLAIRKDLPNAQSIVDRFNAQIRVMITDRTYHRLLHLDWITADVDGDGIAELVPSGDRVGAVAPKAAYSISTVTDKPRPSRLRERSRASMSAATSTPTGPACPTRTKWRTPSVRTRVVRRGRSSRSGGNPTPHANRSSSLSGPGAFFDCRRLLEEEYLTTLRASRPAGQDIVG